MQKQGKGLHMVTFLLLVIGGLNWLIYALFNWEVGMLFGEMNNVVAKVIYILVGLSAIYELVTHKGSCCACGNTTKPTTSSGINTQTQDQNQPPQA